jgi:hypothetical protein
MIPLQRYQGQVPFVLPVYRDVGLILPPRTKPTRQRYVAPTFVGSTTGGGNPTCTTSVVAGVVDGDFLILFVRVGYGTASALSGWTLIYADNLQAVYARIASSEPGSYGVTVPNTVCRSVMHAWRPVGGTWSSIYDALMAWRGHSGAPNNNKIPDNLYFQTCDYVVGGFCGSTANLAETAPSGWTQAGLATGSGGSDMSVGGGYRYFTATRGLSGQGAWNANTGPAIFTYALRAPGQTTLALRSCFQAQTPINNWAGTWNGGMLAGSTASMGVSLPPGVQVGDLILIFQAYKYNTSATPPSFGTPSGYTKKGTDQTYIISAVPVYSIIGCGALYKVATGSDECTITTSATVVMLGAYSLCFSTGPLGSDPTLPGIMGQQNDTDNNTTLTYPAMTLEDYDEDNILVLYGSISQGNIASSGDATGFDRFTLRHEATAGNMNGNVSVAMNGAANPGSVGQTWGSTISAVSLQLAVGAELDGQGATVGQIVWMG